MTLFALEDTITIQQDGEDREIFMSYGLLNELVRIAQTPQAITLMVVDHDLRDTLLLCLLTKRTRTGKPVGENAEFIDEHEISINDMERLLVWGNMHIADFFMRRMADLKKFEELAEASISPEVMEMLTKINASSSNNG